MEYLVIFGVAMATSFRRYIHCCGATSDWQQSQEANLLNNKKGRVFTFTMYT